MKPQPWQFNFSPKRLVCVNHKGKLLALKTCWLSQLAHLRVNFHIIVLLMLSIILIDFQKFRKVSPIFD
jgi:hypothetical protein